MRFLLPSDDWTKYPAINPTTRSVNGEFPVVNLLHEHRKRIYKAVPTAGQPTEWIRYNFITARAVNTILVFDVDMTNSDPQISINANTSDSWSTPPFINEPTGYAYSPLNKKSYLMSLTSPETYRYWRINFENFTSTSDTLSVAKIFIGNAVVMDPGDDPDFSAGITVSKVDPSETSYSENNQSYSIKKTPYTRLDVKITSCSDAGKDTIEAIFDECGRTKPFFWLADDTFANSTLFGKPFYVKYDADPSYECIAKTWNISFSLREQS